MEGENESGGRIGNKTRETLNLLNIDLKAPLWAITEHCIFISRFMFVIDLMIS
jgi:hypothetical protein